MWYLPILDPCLVAVQGQEAFLAEPPNAPLSPGDTRKDHIPQVDGAGDIPSRSCSPDIPPAAQPPSLQRQYKPQRRTLDHRADRPQLRIPQVDGADDPPSQTSSQRPRQRRRGSKAARDPSQMGSLNLQSLSQPSEAAAGQSQSASHSTARPAASVSTRGLQSASRGMSHARSAGTAQQATSSLRGGLSARGTAGVSGGPRAPFRPPRQMAGSQGAKSGGSQARESQLQPVAKKHPSRHEALLG